MAKIKLNEWAGFSLICPDLSNDDFEVQGLKTDMISKNPILRIRRCTGKDDCHNETEIDKYIKDTQLDIWMTSLKADFTKYDSEPTLRSANNFGIAQLSKDKIITKNL